jgi:hypothetical protein
MTLTSIIYFSVHTGAIFSSLERKEETNICRRQETKLFSL